MISLFINTLCPPVNKLFLSVTKFSLYIPPYISFSRLVPMAYVLLLLREPLPAQKKTRVSAGVMHIIRSETLGETFWRQKSHRVSPREYRLDSW